DDIHGGGGDDTIYITHTLDVNDIIDGGSGNDVLIVDGFYGASVRLDSTESIEKMVLVDGNDYQFSVEDVLVAAHETMTIDARGLSETYDVIFDGTKETDGNFIFRGSAGGNEFMGGGGNDIVYLVKNSADTVYLDAGGNDTVHGTYTGVGTSQVVYGG